MTRKALFDIIRGNPIPVADNTPLAAPIRLKRPCEAGTKIIRGDGGSVG